MPIQPPPNGLKKGKVRKSGYFFVKQKGKVRIDN